MLHTLSVDGASQQRAGEEGAECGGEAERVGQKHHAEADAERHYQQRLVAHQRRGLVEQRRQQVDAEYQPQREVQHKHAELERKTETGDTLPDGYGGQDYHHEYPRDVLDHQSTEHKLRKALLSDSEIPESLDDYRG